MNTGRSSLQLSSRYVGTYNRLFQAFTPQEIHPNQSPDEFWSNLLALELDREYLSGKFSQLTTEDCLGSLKPFLNALFSHCLQHARNEAYYDVKKVNSIATLSIFIRCILAKSLAGWEVMEIFAGGVNNSDNIFMDFVAMIDTILGDDSAPAETRHYALQMAVIFMCSINQLSPGAYFLRCDLYPSITSLIKSPTTEQFTFEAFLLLGLLSNFHKSDAAKLNPYIQRLRESDDKDLMHQICWAANFAADAVIKAYQEISDDSPPTLTTTLGSMLFSLRLDQALASKPVDLPRHLFKNQPIEAAVILLPLFELLHVNKTFVTVLAEYVQSSSTSDSKKERRHLPPLPSTLFTLSSYILTHASSISTPRAIVYANLCLNLLLEFIEGDEIIEVFCQPAPRIRLCRQRPPLLPLSSSPQSPICALLNCCVLWLRHNLHMRLEVSCYMTCMRICYRALWYLQHKRMQIEYEWQELWKALLGLLGFLSTKLDNLVTTGGIEQLVQNTISVFDLALFKADAFLPTPRTVHELIYELVRSSDILRKQVTLLQTLAPPSDGRSLLVEQPTDKLSHIISCVEFYEDKISKAGTHSAKDAMRIVAKEVDMDGIRGVPEHVLGEPLTHSSDVFGFIRYACTDGLLLMP